ncbi:hypothetical protein APSETT444_007645 [Aspergillus pseudonomiae]
MEEIRKQAADGIVFLKNANNTLPLKSTKQIAVFGNDAGDFTNGMSVFYVNGVGNYEYGVLAAGGGSGSGLFSYIVSPLEAIKQRAGFRGQTLVQYVLNNSAMIEEDSAYHLHQLALNEMEPSLKALLPSSPDVCLVFLKSWATEGEDRTSLHLDWNGDEVVEKIASACPNTVVVTHSNGVNILPWADHPNVPAILAAHLPGQKAGNSIVDVLWGDVNPSGHLPYTIAKAQSDYSFAPIQNATAIQNTNDPGAWQSDFKEGVLIDYRHFDYYNKTVQYEFGYGLSYTTFAIGRNISITPLSNGDLSALPADAKVIPGGNPNLWEALYRISITVKNTGDVAGAAVPQLYLSFPEETTRAASPVNVLRGFEKVHLQPGESRKVTFELTRRDISNWDVTRQQWVIASGLIQAHVGFSSRDFQATGSFTPIRGYED